MIDNDLQKTFYPYFNPYSLIYTSSQDLPQNSLTLGKDTFEPKGGIKVLAPAELQYLPSGKILLLTDRKEGFELAEILAKNGSDFLLITDHENQVYELLQKVSNLQFRIVGPFNTQLFKTIFKSYAPSQVITDVPLQQSPGLISGCGARALKKQERIDWILKTLSRKKSKVETLFLDKEFCIIEQ